MRSALEAPVPCRGWRLIEPKSAGALAVSAPAVLAPEKALAAALAPTAPATTAGALG